jgi:hypothetical protein
MKHFLILGTVLVTAAITTATAQTAAPSNPPPRTVTRPLDQGPATLSAEQVAKVKSVLSAYKSASLTADDAKAIKRGLRDAGMRHSPALDKAITDAGFSPERLEALDPRPAQPPGDGDRPGGAPPRK